MLNKPCIVAKSDNSQGGGGASADTSAKKTISFSFVTYPSLLRWPCSRFCSFTGRDITKNTKNINSINFFCLETFYGFNYFCKPGCSWQDEVEFWNGSTKFIKLPPPFNLYVNILTYLCIAFEELAFHFKAKIV